MMITPQRTPDSNPVLGPTQIDDEWAIASNAQTATGFAILRLLRGVALIVHGVRGLEAVGDCGQLTGYEGEDSQVRKI
jgi:hypothetical protein